MEELKINMQKYNTKKLILSTTLGMFYYSINNAADESLEKKTEEKNEVLQIQSSQVNLKISSQTQSLQLNLKKPSQIQPQQVENSCCGCCGKKGKETKNEEESQSGGEDNTKKVDTNQEEQGNVS